MDSNRAVQIACFASSRLGLVSGSASRHVNDSCSVQMRHLHASVVARQWTQLGTVPRPGWLIRQPAACYLPAPLLQLAQLKWCDVEA